VKFSFNDQIHLAELNAQNDQMTKKESYSAQGKMQSSDLLSTYYNYLHLIAKSQPCKLPMFAHVIVTIHKCKLTTILSYVASHAIKNSLV